MLSLYIKRFFGLFSPLSFNKVDNRKVILNYHSISDVKWAVPKAKFANQMEWLKQNAEVVSLTDLLEMNISDRLSVAITFDDGYLSVVENALPVMQELGFTGTVYLNTGWINESGNRASSIEQGHYPDEYFMNWNQVKLLQNAGWNIGSHGVEHFDLTKLDRRSIDNELKDSKNEIENRLTSVCDNYCYTWGKYNHEICKQVSKIGYTSAVSLIHGACNESSDRLALPRIDVRREYSIKDFESVLLGRWDYLATLQNIRKNVR